MKQITFLLIMSMATLASAETVPSLINYQGRLSDTEGQPVTGQRDITFSFYNYPATGTPVWAETQSVQVQNGRFNVLLGSVNPVTAPVFSSPEVYLGVKVGTDAEMSPRSRMASVGYAFKAETAVRLEDGGGNGQLYLYDGNKVRRNVVVGYDRTAPTEIRVLVSLPTGLLTEYVIGQGGTPNFEGFSNFIKRWSGTFCTGTLYLDGGRTNMQGFLMTQGIKAYAIPYGKLPSNFTYRSYGEPGPSCTTPYSSGNGYGYVASEVETSLTPYNYPTPITIGP